MPVCLSPIASHSLISVLLDDDYATSVLARLLGKTEDYHFFRNRSMVVPGALFNNATGFMEARNANGTWAGPDNGWTEGDKWAYSFDVVHASSLHYVGAKPNLWRAWMSIFMVVSASCC
jgi:putative alpha-1,2-mannosidase